MSVRRCSFFFNNESECTEKFYLLWDIIPILVVWILFFVATVVHVISYSCFCCFKEDFKKKATRTNYGATDNTTTQQNSAMDNTTSEQPKKKKCIKAMQCFVFKLGYSLVRLLFGRKLGLIRETKKELTKDRFGREMEYINEYAMGENHCLHFMIVLKVIVFMAFCSAAAVDRFFVDSELSCDVSRDCYIVSNTYDKLPISNCTDWIDNRNVSTVCYAIVFDFSTAASVVGGLITTTILETTIIAYMCIFIYKKCCRCNGKWKPRVWFVLQLLLAIGELILAISLYIYFVDNPLASTLRRTGDWISFLGHPFSVALSIIIPWHLVISNRSSKKKILPSSSTILLEMQSQDLQNFANLNPARTDD